MKVKTFMFEACQFMAYTGEKVISKGLNYTNKVYYEFDEKVIDKKINSFIKDKKIISIQQNSFIQGNCPPTPILVYTICYEEEK